MNYYEHHIGDYAAATGHLSLLEDAIYSRLLRRYYLQEGPLPADIAQAARLAGARSADELAAAAVVLDEFFPVADDGMRHNKRADEEIQRYLAKIEAARENGKRGGRPKKANPSPATTQQEPEETQPFSLGSENETQPKAHQTPDTSKGIPSESKGSAPKLALPPWLEPDAWQAWHAFRNSRKGWTAHARSLSLRKLTELHSQGYDPRAVIEQSIERGWTGLFPLREETAHAAPHRLSAVERVRANVEAGNRRDADLLDGPPHAVAPHG